ncbi:MAG: hypothetical protein HYU78_12080 [Rhodocyclales bacterium]|nr:hypothetical protein [Rhodocyclales bacterium]
MAFGTVAEIETFIGKRTSRYLEYLTRKNEAPFRKDHVALQEWQDNFRKKMLFDSVYCSHGEYPLDYAVANGNLTVVQWLLDMGVPPNPRVTSGKGRSIFARCGVVGRISSRPDGLSKEQARERQVEAYRMLLARGGDINDTDPFDAVYGCSDPEMHPILKQLGARVTAGAFESWVSRSNWSVLQELAKGERFDFRGTKLEYRLLRNADISGDGADYQSTMGFLQRLSGFVRLSPGLLPGHPAKPADVPGGFSPIREACYFPEISAYPDFEFVSLVRRANDGLPGQNGRDITDVIVSKKEKPILLVLVNDRKTPSNWVIHRSKDANILGVIVLHTRRFADDTLSFDPSRPAFFGNFHNCGIKELGNSGGRHQDGLQELRLMDQKGPNPSSHTFNPFILRGVPPLTFFNGNQFVVGDASSSSIWISWPDSVRDSDKPLGATPGREREGALFTETEKQKEQSDKAEKYNRRNMHAEAATRFLTRGRLVEARAETAAAFAVDPENPFVMRNLKDIEARIARIDRAVESYSARIRRGDNSFKTLVQRGLAYIDQGDYGRGIEDLDRLEAHVSGNQDIALSRAWGYFRANELGKAMSASRQILIEYSNNGEALSLLAWCELLSGNAASANENALQAMDGTIHFKTGADSKGYALIAAYFSERALRGAAAGEMLLKKHLGELDGASWPTLAVQYLAGGVSESEMLDGAERLRSNDLGNAYAEAVAFLTINSAFSSDWGASRNRMHSLLNSRYGPKYPLAYRLIMNMSTVEPPRILVGRLKQ